MADQYTQWRAELRSPLPEADRLNRPTDPKIIGGFWRIEGARTKFDEPLLIVTDPDPAINPDGLTAFQFGSDQPINTAAHAASIENFLVGRWFSAVAVRKADWDLALETGRWPDQKPSRDMGTEERLDVDLGGGGNAAPIEESLADQIAALAEVIEKQGEPKDQAAADKLAGDLDRVRALTGKAEAERKIEKAPILQAGKDIDAKWNGVAAPGEAAYIKGEAWKKAFLRKETARLAEIARQENLRRVAEANAAREAIEAETAARLKREAEERAAELAANGEDASAEVPTDDEIAARAAEVAAEQVAPVEEVQAERATAGSAYGRKTGLRKVKRGKITDAKAFAGALIDMKHGNVLELLQQLADRAAKAGMPQVGMEIVEDFE